MSAVAASAYRAGEKIRSEYDGIEHDYTRKKGVVHTEILLPDHGRVSMQTALFCGTQLRKSNGTRPRNLQGEIEVDLPRELTHEQHLSLVRRYVKNQFVHYGMCADFAIHDTGSGNPHAHIMLTMRPLNEDKTWRQKSQTVDGKKIPTVDWNEQTKAEHWREVWASYTNEMLREIGCAGIDNRSYERQGIDKIPPLYI